MLEEDNNSNNNNSNKKKKKSAVMHLTDTDTDVSQHTVDNGPSQRLRMPSRKPSGPTDAQGCSVWMRELQCLLPSLTPDQRACMLEFGFWSPTGVWDDFITLGPSEKDSSVYINSDVLCKLESRHLIERAYDPFIVDRPGHAMWRITGGGHDPDRLFHYHVHSLGPGETSSVFKSVFNRVIRHFPRSDHHHPRDFDDDDHQQSIPSPGSHPTAAYPVEAWESLPHAARLIKIVTEADFHEALLGRGEEAVQMMIEVVWLTSCIEAMDELLSQGVFPQSDRAEKVVGSSPHANTTIFRDQTAAHVAAGS